MKRDQERRIVVSMNSAMKMRAWSLASLCDLPSCYVRSSSTVTPYFFCSNIALKPYDKYAIEGSIGVIHQGFEAAWMKNESRHPKQPGFAVILDILNIGNLRNKRHISLDSHLEEDVESFIGSVADILDGMPQSERELIVAHERNELGGVPWSSFSGYAYRTKFQALTEYLSQAA